VLDFDRFEIVTFDCYGTLIDWEAGILAAMRPVLENHAVTADDDKILEQFARAEAKQEQDEYHSYELVLRMVAAELSLRLGFDATPDEVMSLPRSIGRWKPFPDTVAALRKLKSRYKLAIISNIDDRLFEATARALEVPFDWVITAQQVGAYKPSARVFECALEQFGIDRKKILHVAQSLYHDIVPAKSLGIATVWVNRRKGRKGSGATHPAVEQPDVEVTDLASLVRLIGI
jgi:2-haloacid dehalogenase